MNQNVLRHALKLAFDLPADCRKLDAIATQLDLVLKVHETGQDSDAAFCSLLERLERPA